MPTKKPRVTFALPEDTYQEAKIFLKFLAFPLDISTFAEFFKKFFAAKKALPELGRA